MFVYFARVHYDTYHSLSLTECITVAGPFQVKVFIQPHYLHNFVQSTFNALTPEKVRGKGLICVMEWWANY
jgi:hypothetical protein